MFRFIYKTGIKKVVSMITSLFVLFVILSGVISAVIAYKSNKTATETAELIISSDAELLSQLFSRIDSLVSLLETDSTFFYQSLNQASNDITVDVKGFKTLAAKFELTVSGILSNYANNSAFMFVNDTFPLSYTVPSCGSDGFKLENHSNKVKIYRYDDIKDTPYLEKLDNSFDGTAIWSEYSDGVKTFNSNLCYAKKIIYRYVQDSYIYDVDLGVFLISFNVDNLFNQLKLKDSYPSSIISLTHNNKTIYQSAQPDTYDNMLTYNSGIYPGITLTTYMQPKEMNRSFHAQISLLIIILSALFILTILLIGYIHYATVKPLAYISGHLLENNLESIKYYKPLIPEINTLYSNHNIMVERTKTAVRESKDNYYKMLQAQINPHFAYNVLNSISTISLMKGDADTATAIGNVATLLRYGIETPGTIATLKEELDIVNIFASIQQYRYDNKVNIEYNIPTELENCQIPRLTIEPLVENSVFHNDRPLAVDNVDIKISAKKDNLNIIVEIWDHNSTSAEYLNQYLNNNAENPQQRGLGIRNINNRLKLVYGESYGLSYTRADNMLCARLTFPDTNNVNI